MAVTASQVEAANLDPEDKRTLISTMLSADTKVKNAEIELQNTIQDRDRATQAVTDAINNLRAAVDENNQVAANIANYIHANLPDNS